MLSLSKLSCVGLFLAAGTSVFLFALNRWVLHWVDGGIKTSASLLLFASLTAGAGLVGWRLNEPRWVLGPALLLVLVTIGEGRRAFLRLQYRASPPVETVHTTSEQGILTTTQLVTTRYEVSVPILKTHRLRLVQITDLHVTASLPRAYYQHVFAEARALQPDAILLTGDFISSKNNLPLLCDILRNVNARFGVYAVLGNHDHWTDADSVRELLRSAGIQFVTGRCLALQGSSDSVHLCGSEAPWGPSLEHLSPDSFSVVLTHTPDNIYALREAGADIVFAGHTHGGQLRLPLLGAIVVPSIYGRRFDRGHFLVGGTHLFVSAGVGAAAPPLRVLCAPEILVVDLIGSASSSSAL